MVLFFMGKNENLSDDFNYLTSASVGKIKPLSELDDEIYSTMVLGNGYAVMTENSEIYSPVNGVVEKISNNNHSFNIHSDDGLDILVHIGKNSDCDDHLSIATSAAEKSEVSQGSMLCKLECERFPDECDCIIEVVVSESDSLDVFEIITDNARSSKISVIKYKK